MELINPISGDNMFTFVDNGLISCFYDFLSSDSLQIIESSISFVYVVAAASGYENDSLLMFGIGELLIDISLKNLYEQLTLRVLEALKNFFANRINKYEILIESINFESEKIVNLTIEFFIKMLKHSHLLLYKFYDFGFALKLISFLDNSELASSSISLIAIMCSFSPKSASTFLQLNIFDILMNRKNTEHYSDEFYALSGLVEWDPEKIINMLDQSFIEKTINIAMISSFDLKKEAFHFLKKLTLFSEKEYLIFPLGEDFSPFEMSKKKKGELKLLNFLGVAKKKV